MDISTDTELSIKGTRVNAGRGTGVVKILTTDAKEVLCTPVTISAVHPLKRAYDGYGYGQSTNACSGVVDVM